MEAFRFDTRTKRRIEWLWKPFIQRAAINLLTGGPGTGKSTIACDIAAALSTGRPLPGETQEEANKRGILKTLILNAEDDPDDTTLWRLENQGADTTKIYSVLIPEPIGVEQTKWLHGFVEKEGVSLVVVDPVQAWIGSETDMYRPNHMRAWGNQFKALCVTTGVTVLWVRHRRKGDADDHNNINSGLGSIDLSGIVRSELGAIVTKRGSKITRIKGNVGRLNDTAHYEVKDTGDPANDHGQLHWTTGVAQEEPKKGGRKHNEAVAWLVNVLSAGPAPCTQLVADCNRLTGVSETLIREAAKEVVVGEWRGKVKYWRLRTPADKDVQPDIDDKAPDTPGE